MPQISSLNHLRIKYTHLAGRPPKRLTADQKRSLHFFNYESAVVNNREPISPAPDRVIQWTASLYELEAFIAAHGRWPRENNRARGAEISYRERRLATWVRTQRSAIQRDRRCEYQLDRLACIPGYQSSPLEERWNDHFLDYQRFVLRHNRAPRLSSTDREESRLAAWAAKQRYARRNGGLAARRATLLARLPMWAWG